MYICDFEDCHFCKMQQKSVFSALTDSELTELNEAKVCQKFLKGEYVFHEGAYPRGLFCVHNGKLKVVRVSSNGKEQIVHLAKSGDVMGYRALLSGGKYSCSGIAIEESVLCYIPKTVFLSLIEKSHKLAIRVLHMLSVELEVAEKNITDLGILPVRQRIAKSLIILAENYGYKEDKCTLNIALSREEIANLAGTTRETAIRILSSLSEEKLITLNAKTIKINNHTKLAELARFYD